MVLNPPPCTRAFWCYWWGWGGCPVSSLLGSFLPIMTTNYSKCPFQKLRLSQRATTIVIPLVAQVESHTEFVLKNDSVDSLEKREDFALPFTLRKKSRAASCNLGWLSHKGSNCWEMNRPWRQGALQPWLHRAEHCPCPLGASARHAGWKMHYHSESYQTKRRGH